MSIRQMLLESIPDVQQQEVIKALDNLLAKTTIDSIASDETFTDLLITEIETNRRFSQ